MYVFWKYKEEDSSFLLNQVFANLLPVGVYQGFQENFQGDMTLRLQHNNAPESVDISGQALRCGVIRTKQGATLVEENPVNISIVPTSTMPRIDVIYLQYQYQAVENAPLPFYGVLQGLAASNPIAPTLNTPAYQVKIGELYLPANCTALNNGAKWYREQSPILYKEQKTLVIASSPGGTVQTELVLSNYTKELDSLNELNQSTGEFVASYEGLYFFTASVRMDFGAQSQRAGVVIIERWNGTAWQEIVSYFVNKNAVNEYGQVGHSVTAVYPLKKGEKVRCRSVNIGNGVFNSNGKWFITRL